MTLIKLLILLILLISLTACRTVYVVPKIIHPSIPEEPKHKQYEFIPDGEYLKITVGDAKNLGDYIISKNELIDLLTEYLKYYQTELKKFERNIK